MFIKDIALEALQKAGLAHGENVPADRFELAVKGVATALRFYSDCDTIDCFSEHRSVTLSGETTIGKPALKRGVRLHCVASVAELPDLSEYDPNEGDLVVGRDYYHLDSDNLFYGITLSGTAYSWTTAEQSEFCTTAVDIFVKDMGRVTALYNEFGRLSDTSLSKFYGFDGGVYVSNVDGDGRVKLYVHDAGEYDMVYSRRMVFNENTSVDLPAAQEMLIVNHVAFVLARTSERKAQLKELLDSSLEAAQDSSLDSVIPTRSEW